MSQLFLSPESLEELANTTMERFTTRLHEVPAKDLPEIAERLLKLADSRRTLTSEPPPEEEAPPTTIKAAAK